MDALGILIFCVALVLSVMLHETGHFVTAKRFGMKVTQYFFGFGPTLWSVKRGETEYGFKAIPAGGFVKIVGMTSLDEVDPEDEPRSFRRAPGWQRVIVLAAGSFMHFLLAAVLIFGVALAIGVENVEVSNTTQVGTVSPYVFANETALMNGTTCAGEAKSPAAVAGLQVGDKVTSFDGVAVSTYKGLQAEILKVKPGTPVTFTVLRDGHSLTLKTALAEVKGHGSYFGIAPTATTVFQRQNPLDAVKSVGTGFSAVVTGSVQAIGQRGERGRRGAGNRQRGRRPGGLAGQGQLRAAADRVAQHLLGCAQPAAAAADGRRAHRGRDLGADQGLVRPAAAPARPWPGRLH